MRNVETCVAKARARRRAFRQADLAVSPVISTILMVAITVVLAATAFVLVADVGGNAAQPAPVIGLRVEEELDQLEILTASRDADWDRMSVRLVKDEGSGAIYIGTDAAGGLMNEPAAATGSNLAGGDVDLSTTSQVMLGGDFIEFCRAAGGTTGQVTVRLVDLVSNAQVGTFSFDEIPAGTC